MLNAYLSRSTTVCIALPVLGGAPVTPEKRKSQIPEITEVNVKDGRGTLRTHGLNARTSTHGLNARTRTTPMTKL